MYYFTIVTRNGALQTLTSYFFKSKALVEAVTMYSSENIFSHKLSVFCKEKVIYNNGKG